MTTATLEQPTIENIDDVEIPEFDFDMEDFFATNDTPDVATAETFPADEPAVDTMLSDSEPDVEPLLDAATESAVPTEPTSDWPTINDEAVATASSLSPPQAKSIYQQIWEVEHELAEICREEERLKAELKSVKESRIEMVEKLEGLCHEKDNPSPAAVQEQSSTATTGAVGVACSPQTWGLDEIEALGRYGLTEAKVEALRAASSAGHFAGTVASLRDWIARSELWYRDVKGCGASGADKIGDALTKYLAANPMADEPMTPEDEARSVAAAIALGHIAPPAGDATAIVGVASEHLIDAEPSPTTIKAGDILGVATRPSTPCNDGTGEHLVEVALPTAHPPSEDSPAPLASNVKPTPQPKRTRKPKAEKVVTDSPFHEANARQLERVEAIMSGMADPGSVGESTEDLMAAHLAGCEAGAAGKSCSENPFADRSSPQAKEWHRGWEECSASE